MEVRPKPRNIGLSPRRRWVKSTFTWGSKKGRGSKRRCGDVRTYEHQSDLGHKKRVVPLRAVDSSVTTARTTTVTAARRESSEEMAERLIRFVSDPRWGEATGRVGKKTNNTLLCVENWLLLIGLKCKRCSLAVFQQIFLVAVDSFSLFFFCHIFHSVSRSLPIPFPRCKVRVQVTWGIPNLGVL